MTLPIAREFARYGIRVMTIAPGLFLTPLLESLPQEAQDSLGKQVPFPSRLGKPDEFALTCESILQTQMLHGQTISLDGATRRSPNCRTGHAYPNCPATHFRTTRKKAREPH